ncbi:hypothetical protein SMACR_09117 [Sordaria macrospora]|uniref:WGS project CABT00000000 data, contig 2.72 n=2 Tax=Sordaria macrospora TaxID=5147 RepID=F7WBB1_SORMK|nr:uncharacterized protein SMAC_09117 [Sordaria macrospora k-hell]KAA8628895.1 hypothetical protein SMACR_09117 [Sordaria macrospora]KAH7628887.1 hypothetical protein B0T09DRAFT_359003 [Sordaria sp. MPI-SDFR-AT-0083]WPJ57220.1 hypothetical protein SMAC4_09117 [Sordaria macrospora]CCC14389.1 unnamed protein product [Sordaria macrospora k-hell]
MSPPVLHFLLCATLYALLEFSTASSETQLASTPSPTSSANDTGGGGDNTGGGGDDTSDGLAVASGNKKPSAEAIAVFIVVASMVTGLCWVVGEVVMCEVRRYRRERAEHQRQEGPEEIEMTDMANTDRRASI